MQNSEKSQSYYRRKLTANKMKRLILNERKRLKFLIKFLKFAMFVGICALGIFILKLPSWHINQTHLKEAQPWVLNIEGNVVTPTYKIVDVIRQTELEDVGLYRLDIKQLEKNIESLEAIKNAHIRRFWLPARFYIKIDERTPVFVIAPNNETPPIASITSDGIYLGRDYMPISPRFKPTKILSYGAKGDEYENWDKVRTKELIKLTRTIKAHSKQEIEYIDLRNPEDIWIKLSDYLIHFGKLNSTAIKRAQSIESIFSGIEQIPNKKDIIHIDIRLDDSKYLKMKQRMGQQTFAPTDSKMSQNPRKIASVVSPQI